MVDVFNFYVPAKVYFGAGCCFSALQDNKDLLDKDILLVTTGRSLWRLGYIDKLLSDIKKIKTRGEILVWDRISANPQLSQVAEAVSYGKSHGVKIVIGFGGGSALDAAKAIAAGIGCGLSVEDMLFYGKAPSEAVLPVIAIPTTAGTGSELSKGAIISCQERKFKGGIRGKYILPSVAIVDPVFTYDVPYQVTMETGFDVLAHAVESYVSLKATRFSRMLSRECIDIAGKYLPMLAASLDNKEAREKMAYASMLMGINLATTGTALPHRLQYPVGARTDTSHGAGLLALYPAWLEAEYEASSDDLGDIIFLLIGRRYSCKNDVLQAFGQFIDGLGVRKSLSGLGIDAKQIKALAGEVTGNITNDPASVQGGIIERIYENAMK